MEINSIYNSLCSTPHDYGYTIVHSRKDHTFHFREKKIQLAHGDKERRIQIDSLLMGITLSTGFGLYEANFPFYRESTVWLLTKVAAQNRSYPNLHYQGRITKLYEGDQVIEKQLNKRTCFKRGEKEMEVVSYEGDVRKNITVHPGLIMIAIQEMSNLYHSEKSYIEKGVLTRTLCSKKSRV